MIILVSGGSGFIGSSLVERLIKEGHDVINLDIEEPKYRKQAIGEMFLRADIRDGDEVLSYMKDYDVVFHLAARPYIPDGYIDPRGMVETDFMGTMNMLLAAKEKGVKHFVHFSSSEVYGSAVETPMTEDHPTKPISTYAVAKLGADRLVYTFCNEHKIPFTILRQFNVLGERETHHRIIPYMISRMVEHETNIKIGNSGSSRDFTYVEDVADACVRCIGNEAALGETINIGTGRTYKGYDIAYMIAERLHIPKITFQLDERQRRPLDVDVLCASNLKAQKILGWKPKTSLGEALDNVILWRRVNKWKWENYFSDPKYWYRVGGK